MTKWHSDKNGHYHCPHCDQIVTAILATWLPGVTGYVCHHCQIKFDIDIKEVIFRLDIGQIVLDKWIPKNKK